MLICNKNFRKIVHRIAFDLLNKLMNRKEEFMQLFQKKDKTFILKDY